MKIRNGFVSNSSSSSFLIYGVCIGGCESDFDTPELKDDEDISVYELIDRKIPARSEICEYHPSDDIFLGTSWSRVKDDETGAQFKKRVEQEVTDFLKQLGYKGELVFKTFSEAWSD